MTRIIAGAARGRRLRVPAAGTRPTTDRVREALFSALDAALLAEGRSWGEVRVLDLYAGSGALGLEALSRGASGVDLVERDRQAVTVLRANVDAVGLPGARVHPVSVHRLAGAPPSGPALEGGWAGAEIVLADPPYAVTAAALAGELGALAEAGWIAPGAFVVVERPADDPGAPFPNGWHITSQRRYGDTLLWYGRARPATADEEAHA